MSESTIRVGAEPKPGKAQEALDVFEPPKPSERGLSPIEQLRAALAAPAKSEPITLKVPSRPGVTIRYSTVLTQEQRKAWQQRATKKSRRQGREDEVDEMLFTCLVLANQMEAIQFDGIDAHDPKTDEPLTFAQPALWEMVGAENPQECIRKLYANDAHVLTTGGEVLLASGFDDDLDTDPTTAS